MFEHLCTLASTSAICLFLGGQVFAADQDETIEQSKPAVSGINAKLDIQYNYLDFSSLTGHYDSPSVIGSIALPVGHRFGLQIDAGVTHFEATSLPPSATVAGGAAHLFWRDPDFALVGIYGHYANLSFSGGGPNLDLWRLGAEVELYLDRISIEGFAGADLLNAPVGNLDFFSGDLNFAYYANDNFRIHGGIVHQFDHTLGRFGSEVMLPFGDNNISLYADGAFGSGIDSVRGGLRIYFGESGKSLVARHREDDPKARFEFFGLDVNTNSEQGCPAGMVDEGNGNCVEIEAG
ncbi:MAG: hypothetical protein AB3N20_14050 [Rhizobiaceae bacterium]